MSAFMGPFFAQAFQPGIFSVAAIDCRRDKLVPVSDGHAVVNAGCAVINRLLRFANRHCRQHIDRIAEHYWRRMTFSGEHNFPADIVGFAPMNRRICARRNAVGKRSAPLRPVVGRRGAGGRV
jgi:hypothetical protein